MTGLIHRIFDSTVASLPSFEADGTDHDGNGPNTTTGTESPEIDPGEYQAKAEYVLTHLEKRGGRTRQQTLVAETDWSAATVSRVLTRMEDDAGSIERLRDGRAKIVCLRSPEDGSRTETESTNNAELN